MIPRQLVLRNFLSYRQATLPFAGLHLACICGANGAGKSSLLEAIAWALWGQSRASREDDVIYYGEMEAQVTFEFSVQGQTYRVVRLRRREQHTVLELQIQTVAGYTSLTGRSLRATQEKIIQILRLDYATFVNSAYLRQGRADEFMAKRPSERKQLLATLLGLDQYETLAEAARDRARDYKAQISVLEQRLQSLGEQLAQEPQLRAQQAAVSQQIQQQRQQVEQCQQRLQEQQAAYHVYQLQQRDYEHLQQQRDTLGTTIAHLEQQCQTLRQEQAAIADLEARAPLLEAAVSQWQRLKTAEAQLQQCFANYQRLRQERDRYQQNLDQQRQDLLRTLHGLESQQQFLLEQCQQLEKLLKQENQIVAAFEQLQRSRAQLQAQEELQQKVFPLLQAKQRLELERQQQEQRLRSRRDELQQLWRHLHQQVERQPALQEAVTLITAQIETLEKQRIYQDHVREKGLERRRFLEQLQARQREYERQINQLEQRLELLNQPGAICPLCQRPLDAEHHEAVLRRNAAEKEDLLNQLWVIREQLAVTEREIQVLRREYITVGYEISQLTQLFEQRGQLQQQLQSTQDLEPQLDRLAAEIQQIERQLRNGHQETLGELQAIEAELKRLNYDEKNLAIARGQVEKWRWAEAKEQELRQAQRQYRQIQQQLPALVAQQEELQRQLNALETLSPLSQTLATIDQQLAALAYDPEQHAQIQAQLAALEPDYEAYQTLQRGRSRQPQLRQDLQHLEETLHQQREQLQRITDKLATLEDTARAASRLAAELNQRQQELLKQQQTLEANLAQQGKLTAELEQLHRLAQEYEQGQQTLAHLRHQYRLYCELAQALGKNGIPAMLIETVLPHLEAETNHILGRLSNHQLHVQFITQRSRRRSGADTKPIETLDILIADCQGTRPYESYSGGEAFRINFALRLALARLLAQRSGSDVQFLIIDEGFGTQDAQGCERLIAALNAIAPEFHCILAITHVPALKEAFQTRIEVTKIGGASQLSIIT
ncbi:SMC family ATPase [Thermosynechococcus sp. HY213]|uniref:SMC family ATPase n=1 Tax=Thermosynechococcus sp. HY213 TaxID=3074104 RepID=UPI00285DB6FE|nr:SMC family ATPase [Thermosynechococcus sp. HY213]MDR7922515.1 SMC family ATPase [Thermosynechococcus sp. HY213]